MNLILKEIYLFIFNVRIKVLVNIDEAQRKRS